MGARHDLKTLIAAAAPDTWEIYGYPTQLTPLDDATKPIAIVIEQRSITAGTFSPDGDSIPVAVEIAVWIVIDASTGRDRDELEDELEAAAEQMIRILLPMPNDVWDGAAERTSYDAQKPAYQFTIRAAGALTQEV
jgi:hypothetical protein